MIKNTRIIVLFLLFGLSFLSFLFSRAVTSPNEKAVFHSRATTSGKTITVSGVSRVAIQQAIDSAKDGDTIIIPQGTYLSSDSEPFELPPDYPGKNKPDGCFINLRGKSLILKGQGAILFGEGHDKAYVEPLASRVGVCSFGGSITIDNVRIKEFQKGCGFFINVALIVKNSIIEGCDEGGLKLLGDSTALFVNNYFVATNAFSMMGNSNVKAVNNTMYSSNVFYFPQADFIPKAELINNIIVNGEFTFGVVNGSLDQANNLKDSIFSYNVIWKENKPCNSPGEYCEKFSGKIEADPLFIEPVIDQRGMAAWANFGLKEGSPAVGIGDPKIPGPKNIGISGGPCADPNSSVCSSFIQSNLPTLPTPTPEQEGINREPDVTNKNESLGRGEFYKVESEVGPQQNKRTMFVKQGTLFLQNSSSDKTFKIIGLSFQGQQNVSVEKNLDKATVLQYDYSGYCGGLINEVKSGLLYSSSSDNFSSMKYKQLVLNCFRAEVVDFE